MRQSDKGVWRGQKGGQLDESEEQRYTRGS